MAIPKLRTVVVRMPEQMRANLEQIAEREDRSVSWVVRKAIEQYLRRVTK